jgi:MtN3 and saliva related transmembrane protein
MTEITVIDHTRMLELLVSLVGILMGLANIPQALKIYRTRSAKDVSELTYGVLSAGYFVLLIYSVSLDNFALIITNLFGLLGVGLVLSGIIRYEKKGQRHRGI